MSERAMTHGDGGEVRVELEPVRPLDYLKSAALWSASVA